MPDTKVLLSPEEGFQSSAQCQKVPVPVVIRSLRMSPQTKLGLKARSDSVTPIVISCPA